MSNFISLLSPLRNILGHREDTSIPVQDCNDPADGSNLLGTVCDVHGCQRLLGEAPVVTVRQCPEQLSNAKRRLFPHSWTVIATYSPASRGRWFSRNRKSKSIAVRYCETCRSEAERWMHEHPLE